MHNRVESSQRRVGVKDWNAERRERTHHLIELGGLVQKAGLVELTNDDRAVLFGAFLRVADIFREEDAETTIALCRRRGKRTFDAGL